MANDALNRMTTRTYPNEDAERWSHDANGNAIAYAKGADSAAYQFDALNREILVRHFPSGHEMRTTYTLDGKRDSVVDYRGLTQFEYDNRGRLSGEEMPNGDFIESDYDAQGNRVMLTTPFGQTRYSFDALNRMDSVVSSKGKATRYFYNAVGNRDSVQNANGTAAGYAFDALNRLLEVRNWSGSGLLSRFTYSMNAAGIRTVVDELDGSRVVYAYDDLYRLTGEMRTGSHAYSNTFTYDDVGNRLAQVKNGVTTTYAYNNRDQLTGETSPAGAVAYTYDAAGRQVSKSDANGTVVQTWVDGDRLAAVTGPGVNSQYEYDADGRRVKETADGLVRQYLIDRLLPYGQVILESDGVGGLKAEYVYGLDRASQERDGNTHWYLADGQGSVRQLADSNGFVSDTYGYTAFGEPLVSTGTTANDFLYVGEQLDPNSGLYYNRARWMDPRSGRFLGIDPVAGKKTSPLTLHRYLYAGASPVSFEDPSGRFFTLSGVLTGISVYGISQAIHYTVSHFYYLGGKRPDDDGRITFIEAGLWWKHGNGQPLTVPLSSVDLTGITRENFWKDGVFSPDRKFNLLSPSYYSSFDDGMVYGTLNLSLGAGTPVVETDGGDDYDFDPNLDMSLGIMHFLGRNAETVGASALHGFGKPFRINLTGTGHISE